METRIWNEKITLKIVEKTVNDYIEKEILNLENKEILEKWNYLSLIGLGEEATINKFLEVVEYIDELSLDKGIKVQYILTLVYLVLKVNLKIADMNENSIFLLVSYLNNFKIKELNDRLNYLNDEKLLFQIRIKSLDLNYREKLIAYVDKKRDSIIDVIKFIKDTEYYELLKEIES